MDKLLKDLQDPWYPVADCLPAESMKVDVLMTDGKTDYCWWNGTDFVTIDPIGNGEITHWKRSKYFTSTSG